MQRFLFSEQTRSTVYNGVVYNDVKMFHSGSQHLCPTKVFKKGGLCPTKSALHKQVKKFPGNNMYLY